MRPGERRVSVDVQDKRRIAEDFEHLHRQGIPAGDQQTAALEDHVPKDRVSAG